MTLLVDYSMARPAPATIKGAGYSGAMRYVSTDPRKNLQPSERDALLAAGLSIGLVWETTANRAADGFTAGGMDAKAAEAQAAALGMPAGLPIFYAVDFAADPATIKPYFDGARSTATRPIGIYGSLHVVDTALAGGWATYAWQSCAWSGGVVSQRAHLYQRLRATVPTPVPGTDENIVLRAFPLWTKAAATPAPPASDIPPVFTKPPAPKPAPKPAPRPAPVPPPPIVRIGWKGAAIQRLQLGLNRVFPAYSHLRVDGNFGPATAAVVQEFQRRSHLTADGVVGPATRAALARSGITF